MVQNHPLGLSAGAFQEKSERLLSIIMNIDLDKTVSTQLMMAAACLEMAEFLKDLETTTYSELNVYTGSLSSCRPSLETYLKRFKEAKNYLWHSIDPDCVWSGVSDVLLNRNGVSSPVGKSIQEKRRESQERDLKTLEYVKRHHIVEQMQSEEDEDHRDFFIIGDEVIQKDHVKEGEPRNYRADIDSWATGLKTEIPLLSYLLSNLCNDVIDEIKRLNDVTNKPQIVAMAKGLETLYQNYLACGWPEKQADIDLKKGLYLREYNEDDEEEVRNALFRFYDDMKENEKPFLQDLGFIHLWQKHLSKDPTSENYKALAQEILSSWSDYQIKSLFKGGTLWLCFYEIHLEEFISSELKVLRKSARHSSQTTKSTKNRPQNSFLQFVIDSTQTENILKRLHELIDKKKPKICILTIFAAQQKGWITLPTHSAISEEFPEIGDRKNLKYYVDRKDNYKDDIDAIEKSL